MKSQNKNPEVTTGNQVGGKKFRTVIVTTHFDDPRLKGLKNVEIADASELREDPAFSLDEEAFLITPVERWGWGTVCHGVITAFERKWQWCNLNGYFCWVAIEKITKETNE